MPPQGKVKTSQEQKKKNEPIKKNRKSYANIKKPFENGHHDTPENHDRFGREHTNKHREDESFPVRSIGKAGQLRHSGPRPLQTWADVTQNDKTEICCRRSAMVVPSRQWRHTLINMMPQLVRGDGRHTQRSERPTSILLKPPTQALLSFGRPPSPQSSKDSAGNLLGSRDRTARTRFAEKFARSSLSGRGFSIFSQVVGL